MTGDTSALRLTKPVKCVVWDLDNTVWDGVLLEDGDGRPLRPGVREAIEELDRRGILQSIASRNDHEAAARQVAGPAATCGPGGRCRAEHSYAAQHADYEDDADNGADVEGHRGLSLLVTAGGTVGVFVVA